MICKIKPRKISLYLNSNKNTITQIKSLNNCDYIMNGGLFNANWTACCHLKIDGVVYAKDQYTYFGYAWNTGDNHPVVVTDYSNYDNYIACMMAVKDGKPQDLYYNADVGGLRPRSAIGILSDGSMLLYCDKTGYTPEGIRNYLLSTYSNLDSLLILDGGNSSQCIFDTYTVDSDRIVQNLFCAWKPIIYRVQCGAFLFKYNADRLLSKIKNLDDTIHAGYANSYVRKIGLFYKVQVGAFSKNSGAELVLDDLKSKGYSAFITTE